MNRKINTVIKCLTAIILLAPATALPQQDTIPTVKGKVTFTKNIKTNLQQKEIHDRIVSYVNEYLKPVEGYVAQDQPDKITCNVTDYVIVSSQMMHTFAMYMNYSLAFMFCDSVCITTITNITFMEKETFEKQKKWKNNPNGYLNYPKNDDPLLPIYSAEQIFIKNEYRLTFYRRASQRITAAATQRITEALDDINDALILPEKELKRIREKIKKAEKK
jgi:hypothetical protein